MTRRPRTPAVDTAEAASRFPSAPPRRAGADAVRLALIDPVAPRTTLDGAWWPRTSDLTAELPPLLEELHRRGIRITRVTFHPDSWPPTTRRLQTGGRTVRLGWFRRIDRHLLNLTGDLGRARLDLLVVPPSTTAGVAQRAFDAATDRANRDEPTALLDGLGTGDLPVPPPRAAAATPDDGAAAAWDTDGGHPAR
ncbi:DUF5994 family protein [Geodermatophilus sp. SYSU D00684]